MQSSTKALANLYHQPCGQGYIWISPCGYGYISGHLPIDIPCPHVYMQNIATLVNSSNLRCESAWYILIYYTFDYDYDYD